MSLEKHGQVLEEEVLGGVELPHAVPEGEQQSCRQDGEESLVGVPISATAQCSASSHMDYLPV